jgi:hypothetical protein
MLRPKMRRARDANIERCVSRLGKSSLRHLRLT